MFERFTDDARHVVVAAQEDARDRDHNYIGSEHLLLALVRDHESTAARTLEAMGVDLDGVRAQVDEVIGTGKSAPSGHIPFTPSAKKVLEFALREALQLEDTFIGTEHLLLGVIREGGGVGATVLAAYGVELEHAREEVVAVRDGKPTVAEGHLPPPISRRGTVPRGMLQTWSAPIARQVPRCSLCGRDEARCDHVLIAGGVRLCSDCARSAVAQLDGLPPDAPRLIRYRRPEVAPSDKDRAILAIEQAFDSVTGPMALDVDDALAFCEGGEACREFVAIIRAVGDDVPVVINDQTIERVRFLAEDEAEVSVGIWLAGNPQPMIQPAHAVREDGTWKVSRSSVARFAQQARPFLRRPPDF